MESVIQDILAKDGRFDRSKMLMKVVPSIDNGTNEQQYTAHVLNMNNSVINKYTYTNSELLEFIYDQIKK